MAENTTLGVGNISTGSGNSTDLGAEFFQDKVGEVFLGNVAGGTQLGGMLFLAMVGFALYQSEVGSDISAVVLIPLMFFMASEGFLPFGQGIFYGMILAVSAITIFGVIKYADR